uniref:(California timema) hypothetical protein n=1 Tax=Timema californicum TaxID=61474 RepID=A0A7R9JF14_TIMCA|nr:unnamed protein product [Timema californicum]
MKCEDIEEDNKKAELLFPNSGLGHLSFPYIKEEIKALTVACLTACHLKTRGIGVGRFGFTMSGADRLAPDRMPY